MPITISPMDDAAAGDVEMITCSNNELIQMKLKDPSVILTVICLVIINLTVIAGNILVILAVSVSHKLRTVTNFFIVSLAVADLLLGLTVVPYSLSLAVLDVWIFGRFWCLGWLVIDVWLSTASILNLCAISVDRYLAITRPVRYRSIMTSRRAKMIIAFVWILSFLVSFPPLLGWTEVKDSTIISGNNNNNNNNNLLNHGYDEKVTKYSYASSFFSSSSSASSSSSSIQLTTEDNSLYAHDLDAKNYASTLYQNGAEKSDEFDLNDYTSTLIECNSTHIPCVLFTSTGYVTYSALGSFFIPMSFMLFFYWRIYVVASRATRALKRGYKTTGKSKNENRSEERLTLRMHRGYICENINNRANPHHQLISSMTSNISSSTHCNTSSFITNDSSPKQAKTLIKFKSHHNNNNNNNHHHHSHHDHDHDSDEYGESNLSNKKSKKLRRKKPITVYKLSNSPANEPDDRMKSNSNHDQSHGSSFGRDSDRSNSSKSVRFSRRTNVHGKWQAKRLLAETKAAKTVGIIVGGFIICWFPFFTTYLIRGYCKDQNCIPSLLLTIFTWLGYANSAVNPIIYGMFSRDFRRAFANIICKCKYSEETGVTSLIRQIHLPNLFEDDNHDEIKTDSQEDVQ